MTSSLPGSQWRSRKEHLSTASSRIFAPNIYTLTSKRSLDSATCMCVHDEAGLFAVGGMRNGHSVLGLFQSVECDEEESQWGIKLLGKVAHPGGSVLSASWIADTIVTGTREGSVSTLRMDPDDTRSAPFVTSTMALDDSVDVGIDRDVSSWSSSTHVNAVGLCPGNRHRFFALGNNRLRLCDVGESTVVSTTSTPNRLQSGDWCSNNEHVVATTECGPIIRVYDARTIGSRAQAEALTTSSQNGTSHTGSVHSVKWSPLVPHWLATGGADGVVKIWDARNMSQSFATLEAHTTDAYSVAWSNCNAEHLLSAGGDGNIGFWSLTSTPHFKVCSVPDRFETRAVGVAFSRRLPNVALAVGCHGETLSLHFTNRLLRQLCPMTRVETTNPRIARLRSLLYLRDDLEAVAEATNHASVLVKRGKPDEAEEVIAMVAPCVDRPPFPVPFSVDPKDLNDLDITQDAFNQHVLQSSRATPGLMPLWLRKAPSMRLISTLASLRVSLECAALASDPETAVLVLERHKDIVDYVSSSLNDDPRGAAIWLRRLFKHAIVKAPPLALALLVDCGRLFAKSGCFDAFAPVAVLALQPTIFGGRAPAGGGSKGDDDDGDDDGGGGGGECSDDCDEALFPQWVMNDIDEGVDESDDPDDCLPLGTPDGVTTRQLRSLHEMCVNHRLVLANIEILCMLRGVLAARRGGVAAARALLEITEAFDMRDCLSEVVLRKHLRARLALRQMSEFFIDSVIVVRRCPSLPSSIKVTNLMTTKALPMLTNMITTATAPTSEPASSTAEAEVIATKLLTLMRQLVKVVARCDLDFLPKPVISYITGAGANTTTLAVEASINDLNMLDASRAAHVAGDAVSSIEPFMAEAKGKRGRVLSKVFGPTMAMLRSF